MFQEKIINIITNEEIYRDYTKAELEELKKEQELANARIEQAQIRDEKRKSALAKLAALGLTEDEIAAL